MAFTVAVSGKGGTGKSTVAALIISELVASDAGSVLAVDADPNYNLGMLLGQEVEETVADIREKVLEDKLAAPTGMSKHRVVEYGIQKAVQECEGFDLLTMGRPEGPGCYCYVNSILRKYLDVLANDYSFVIIDNEAGMEHLSRRTTTRVDLLLMVTQPLPAGIAAVERIIKMIKDLPVIIKRKKIILNQLRMELPEKVEAKVQALGVEVAVRLKYNQILEEAMITGQSLLSRGSDFIGDELKSIVDEIRTGGD